jgi:hypothetical protein
MPTRDRAAYMREYRTRTREKARAIALEHIATGDYVQVRPDQFELMIDTITTLKDEVARLKRELATRTTLHAFNSAPFTPAPKPGRKR